MSTYAIYVITNSINGKQYVGITKRLNKRWVEHKRAKGDSVALYSAIKKYGSECFVFSHVADAFDKESACIIEKLLIKEKNTIAPFGYNMTSGGDGGFFMSEESRKKMSDSKLGKPSHNKGKKLSKETVEKISIARKGKPWNPEQRKKIMAGRVGEKRSSFGMKGKNHSEETKEKMRIAQRARFDAEKAIKKASEVTL